MRRMMRTLALPALLAAAAPAQGQELGAIAGQVIDEANAITLPGVPVELSGPVEQIEYTDIDGAYRFQVPAGSYEMKVVMAGYAEQSVSLDVAAGQLTRVQVSLASNVFAEQVTVSAPDLDAESSTAAAQLMLRMRAPAVQDNIGSIEMSANDDSNAADAMERVTGVSVVGGGSVFVRGLGERYSNTTLNGAMLPTTEPDRRVVPLDLFPAALIDSVQVSKTYTPDKPSQFAGGLVEIIPLKLPAETSWEAGAGGGWNSVTTGALGLSYPSGGREWTGFDDGARALPAGFPDRKVIRGGRFTDDEVGFLQSDLRDLGRAFSNVWDPVDKDHPIDQSYSGLFGGRFDKLGVVATLRHAQSSAFVDERRTFFNVEEGGAIDVFNGPYDFDVSTYERTLGAVGNVAYQFTPNHRLSFNNFYTHLGTDRTRRFEGFNSDADTELRNQRLYFIEEQIRAHHLGGDHLLPGASNSRFDWKVAFSYADRDEPDLRETLYEFDPARDAFVLADESQSGLRQFNDQRDESIEFSANWSMLFQQWSGLGTQIKFGGGYLDRERAFAARRLRFTPRRLSGVDLSLPAEALFASANVGPVWQLKEETRPTDAYDGGQETASGYGMIDLPLTARWRVVGGARVESYKQTVDTFDPFSRQVGGSAARVTSTLDSTDVFPAANLVYALAYDQNLRISYSRTVNRPEFREVAPFEFTDVVGGRAVVGNPDLGQSLIQNVDARWEWFPGAEEVISASFFYKHFDTPIERVVEPTAQLRTSYANAEAARNVGIELEARKALNERLLVGANYTFVDSEVTIGRQAGQVQTSLLRPLAGTSRNLFNAMAEFRMQEFAARLLWSYFGDRISDVGSLGLPDIIEEGRNSVDVIVSRRWDAFGLKVAFENLLDDPYLFTQSGREQRVFKLGRGVSFSVTLHP